MYHFKHYADILKSEYELRKKTNPSYSLRAFASKLGLTPSRLSEVMNRKKGLSLAVSEKICHKLKLNEKEKNYFLLLVANKSARSTLEKKLAQAKLEEVWKQIPKNELSDGVFSLLSEWYYFAIIEFLKLKKVPHSIKGISQHFGLESKETKEALERLSELKLIRREGDKYLPLENDLITTDGIYSRAIRKYHQQILAKAKNAIESQSTDQRYLSALTIAIDKKLIPEINERIKNFRKEINLLITNHAGNIEPDSVYCLSAQFFSLMEDHHE